MSKVFIEDENKNILANANEDPFIIDQVGTDVFVNGQRQDRLDFTSDPQEQLDELDKQVTDKTDLTTLASKVETNTSEISTKLKGKSSLYKNKIMEIPKGSYKVIICYGSSSIPILFKEGEVIKQSINAKYLMIFSQFDSINIWYIDSNHAIKEPHNIIINNIITIDFGDAYRSIIEIGD